MDEISTQDSSWISAAANRFERDWKLGLRPRIEDFLAEMDESRWPPLLGELMRVESELRRREGEQPAGEEYHHRFPGHVAVIDAVFLSGLASTPEDHAGDRPTEPGTRLHQLGDYEMIRELGRGGMGIVFEARQISLDRPVALKLLPPEVTGDPKRLRRFEREARAAGRLHHTNIVPVFGLGQFEETHFYIMQLIRGPGLDAVIGELRRLRRAGTNRDDDARIPCATTTPGDPVLPTAAELARSLATGRFEKAPPGSWDATAPRSDSDSTDGVEPGGRGPGDAAGEPSGTLADAGPADPGESAVRASARIIHKLERPEPDLMRLDSHGERPTDPSQGPTVDQPDGPAPVTPAATAAEPSRSSTLSASGSSFFDSVARLGRQAAEGLDHAHAQGILHRDIKPSNLLLDLQGNVWITDFGLAKAGDSDDLSGSRDVIGTLRYMAPERFEGRADARSDVYALGLTLYELLALRPAFDATSHERLISQVTREEAAPLRKLDPAIPRDLATIVHRAIAREAPRRYATAAALAEDLGRYLDRQPVRARRTPPHERFLLWCQRNPWLAASNIAAATLTTLLAIGSTWAAVTFYEKNRNLIAEQGRTKTAERSARLQTFDALASEAQARRFSRRPGQRFDSLDALARAARIGRGLGLPAEPFDTLRDEAIAAMALPDVRPIGRPIAAPPDAVTFAFDPAKTRYALLDRNGEIVVRRVADDADLARFRTPGDHENFVFTFSPDGRYLASMHPPNHSLTVWDVDRGRVCFDDSGPVCGRSAGFLPDGRRFLLIHVDGQALLYDLGTGQVTRRWAGPPGPNGFAFRLDGAQVAVVYPAEKTCRLLDVETGRIVQTIQGHSAESVAWSPDGSMVALGCYDDGANIHLWDISAGTWRGVLKGHTNSIVLAGFHPAGTLLASSGWETNLRLWEPQLGRPLLTLSGYGGTDFGPDGRVVLLQDENLVIHEVDPATEYRTLAHPLAQQTAYREVSVHPGGRLLAVGTDRGLIFWDLARGTELALLPIGRAPGVRFADSGEMVTSGDLGVCRWPVRIDADGHSIQVGPPHRLPLPDNWVGFGMDRSGRVVALPSFSEALVHTPERDFRIRPLDDCRGVAISADGQWLATGYHSGMGAHVWRIRDSAKVADLPTGVRTNVAFSPDGRYLMTNGGPCRLWEVGAWTTEAHRIGDQGLAFTPDSRALVAQDDRKLLRLVECATGRTLARFENPDQFEAVSVTFSPDGVRMIVSTPNGPSVHVWDLRAIRRKLATMGLDWDAPAYTEIDPAAPDAPPLRSASVDFGTFRKRLQLYSLSNASPEAKVEGYSQWLETNPDDAEVRHRRGHALFHLKRYDEAIADFTAALKRSPNNPHLLTARGNAAAGLNRLGAALADCEAALRLKLDPDDREPLAHLCNDLAWPLVAGPASTRDPARALNLAQQAVKLAPGMAIYLNTLGVAQYRVGQHAEAIATLDRSLAAGKGESDAFDLFFLAMARHTLGQVAQARADFDRAVKWRRDHPNLAQPGWSTELDAFQAEAQALLDGLPLELPADVFAREPPSRP